MLHRYNDDKGAAGFLMGGWQYSTFMTYQTGQPFTVNTSYDVNMDGNLTDRIDTLNGLALVDSRQQKLRLTTNPTALLALLGNNGRVGRNVFRASGVAKTDFALVKNFNVSEGQIRPVPCRSVQSLQSHPFRDPGQSAGIAELWQFG